MFVLSVPFVYLFIFTRILSLLLTLAIPQTEEKKKLQFHFRTQTFLQNQKALFSLVELFQRVQPHFLFLSSSSLLCSNVCYEIPVGYFVLSLFGFCSFYASQVNLLFFFFSAVIYRNLLKSLDNSLTLLNLNLKHTLLFLTATYLPEFSN